MKNYIIKLSKNKCLNSCSFTEHFIFLHHQTSQRTAAAVINQMENKIKLQIELAIARLERANEQLKKFRAMARNLTVEEVDEISDEISDNEKLIEKLKRGL